MFETLPVAPPDSILGLSEEFQKDPRADKVNLTVGVFKDEKGLTPVLQSVKAAEQGLWIDEKTKGYLGIDGMGSFNESVAAMALGESFELTRTACLQTPGGTGALRTAADLLSKFSPSKRIWLSDPTWANHQSIFSAAGLQNAVYPYLSSDRVSADIDGMIAHLDKQAEPGDLICLHACCHNPTGIDPTPTQWDAIASLISKKRLLPLIDFAYQGFGDGLAEDRGGLEKILAVSDEAIVCASLSKNFGLYSERTGLVIFIGKESNSAVATLSQAKQVIRCNYSNPPRHGAAIVAKILGDAQLTQQWTNEVDGMRKRIDAMRSEFIAGMKATSAEQDFSFLQKQKGMFSYSGLNAEQASWLKKNRGIYILGSGRINVAGMASDSMQYLCESIAESLVALN